MGLTGCAEEPVPPRAEMNERIGVYDSRSIVIAFRDSELCNKWLSGIEEEQERAKAMGDQNRVAELEAEAAERNGLMHKQAFSTAPVDNILEQIEDRLPAIKEKTGVGVLVSKWDKDALTKHASAESVDVTSDLVKLFNPSDEILKIALDIRDQEPVPIEKFAD